MSSITPSTPAGQIYTPLQDNIEQDRGQVTGASTDLVRLTTNDETTNFIGKVHNKQATNNTQLTVRVIMEHQVDTKYLLFASLGNCSKVKNLLNAGVNKNAQGHDSRTALMIATDAGNYCMVRLLIDEGVDVDKTDDSGMTALMKAAHASNSLMVMLLIDKGVADVNKTDNSGMTALMHCANITGSRNNDPTYALISAGINKDAQDKTGKTALMYAVINNQYSVALELLMNDVNMHLTDQDGYTAFDYTKMHCDPNSAMAIMLNNYNENSLRGKQGGDDQVTNFTDRAYNEPETNDMQLEATLIRKQFEPDTRYLLDAELGDHSMVKNSLNAGVNKNVQDHYGKTALMLAADAGDNRMIKLLIDEGVDVNTTDNSGMTALMHCANSSSGNPMIAHALINAEINKDAQDKTGKTALMYAVLTNEYTVALQLLIDNVDIHLTDQAGYTALDYAKQQYGPKSFILAFYIC